MKTLLQAEEFFKTVVAWYLTTYLGFPWWAWFAWFLAPDISILAYALNPRIGAWVYNLFHHQGLAAALALTGLYLGRPDLQFAGLVLLGHSSFDRILGYGLKYPDSFKHTHLGWIGKVG